MIPAEDIRSAVEASWRAAKATSEAGGVALVLTAPSAAGMYLELAGSPSAAIRLLPHEQGPFTGRVLAILRSIDTESKPLRLVR